MATTEHARHQLYRRLTETIGPDEADTLMELLPPAGLTEVATKTDLAALADQMSSRFRRRRRLAPRRGPRHRSRGSRRRGLAVVGGRGRRRRRRCDAHGIPVTARGSGTGLSGAAIPHPDGIVLSFDQMDRHRRDRRGQPGGGGAARRHPRPARPGPRPAGARLPGVPGRVQRQPGRKRGHQRRRHAGREVRRHPPPGAGPAGGAAERRGDHHRRAVREGLHRLRPHPADHRLRGHPGRRHRGDPQALPPPRAPGHGARAVHHPRPGHPRCRPS
jgi:hypothetical protein